MLRSYEAYRTRPEGAITLDYAKRHQFCQETLDTKPISAEANLFTNLGECMELVKKQHEAEVKAINVEPDWHQAVVEAGIQDEANEAMRARVPQANSIS